MYTTQDPPVESRGRPAFFPPLFGISTAREKNTYAIRIEGELDLSECPRLEQALRRGEASHATRILLDLEELTFVDANLTGLDTVLPFTRT